jgi:hypothetical protein
MEELAMMGIFFRKVGIDLYPNLIYHRVMSSLKMPCGIVFVWAYNIYATGTRVYYYKYYLPVTQYME